MLWIVSQFLVEAVIAAIMAIAVFKTPPQKERQIFRKRKAKHKGKELPKTADLHVQELD
jgi:Flp pilus assembly protein TadB